MVGVPKETPVTTPEPNPTEANAVLLLVHAPNAVISLNTVVAPTQALGEPLIAAGDDVMFSTSIAMQPVGNV